MPDIRKQSKGRRDVWFLPVDRIKIDPAFNVRDERPDLVEHIESIALSILNYGYDHAKPITVYPAGGGDYFVSDGHCRRRGILRAIELGAAIEAIPVMTEAKGVGEADRTAGLLTRNNGLHLTSLEMGRVYKRLASYGWSDQKIADTTGKTMAHVAQIWKLMEASPETHAQVVNGVVSATTVANTVRDHGPVKAKAIINRAAKASLGKKVTPRAVKAAASSEPTIKTRRDFEIVNFFRTTVNEQDGPPGVQQAVMGGDPSMSHHFDADAWLVDPTQDMRVYKVNREQLDKLIAMVEA